MSQNQGRKKGQVGQHPAQPLGWIQMPSDEREGGRREEEGREEGGGGEGGGKREEEGRRDPEPSPAQHGPEKPHCS